MTSLKRGAMATPSLRSAELVRDTRQDPAMQSLLDQAKLHIQGHGLPLPAPLASDSVFHFPQGGPSVRRAFGEDPNETDPRARTQTGDRQAAARVDWSRYTRFLYATVVRMREQTSLHQLDATQRAFRPASLPAAALASGTEDPVGVICYGKSLTYLLQYLWFGQFGTRPVLCVCDQASFQQYQREAASVSLQPSCAPFPEAHNLVQELERRGNQVCPVDLSRVYFAACAHPLALGVGGKRALVQHLAVEMRAAFVFTLDDNVSGVYAAERCGKRTVLSAYVPSAADREARERIYTQLAACAPLTLGAACDHLRRLADAHPQALLLGLEKGDAKGEEGMNKVYEGSTTVYKFNLARPQALYARWYLYNPYFTRFFEDIAFNAMLCANRQVVVDARYFLRFAHNDAPAATVQEKRARCAGRRDNPDLFPAAYPAPAASVAPVFLMYVLWFAIHVDAGWIAMRLGEATCTALLDTAKNKISMPVFYLQYPGCGASESGCLKVPKDSKYGKFSLFLYAYALQYYAMVSAQPPLFDLQRGGSRQSLLWLNAGGLVAVSERAATQPPATRTTRQQVAQAQPQSQTQTRPQTLVYRILCDLEVLQRELDWLYTALDGSVPRPPDNQAEVEALCRRWNVPTTARRELCGDMADIVGQQSFPHWLAGHLQEVVGQNPSLDAAAAGLPKRSTKQSTEAAGPFKRSTEAAWQGNASRTRRTRPDDDAPYFRPEEPWPKGSADAGPALGKSHSDGWALPKRRRLGGRRRTNRTRSGRSNKRPFGLRASLKKRGNKKRGNRKRWTHKKMKR